MASGISTKLPLSLEPDDGIKNNKTYREVAKQNLLNILLCIPGERVMLTDFGVGLKRYLFETDTILLRNEIASKIKQQVQRYLSYIEIIDIQFQSFDDNNLMDVNLLSIKIKYTIIPLGTIDEIVLNRENDDIVTT